MHKVTYYGLFTVERIKESWFQSHLAHLEIGSIAYFMPVLIKLFQFMGNHLAGKGMQST